MDVVLYEKKEGIGVITLNRPKKLNALSAELLELLQKYMHEAGDDPEVKVIVLRAAGEKAFTAGFDLNETVDNNIVDVVARRADTRHEVEFFMYMWYLPKPIIASVQGYCIGGGLQLCDVSDLVIAADNATFGNPENLLGYTCQMSVDMFKLPLNKLTEWLFLSKYFSAEELREVGYVNEVVPLDKLEERTMEIAQQVAKIPAESMAIMKETLRMCYDMRGLTNTMRLTAETYNLNRLRMQQNEAASFGKDVQAGGLSAALKDRYN